MLLLLNELYIIDLTFRNNGLKDASDSFTISSVNASFIELSTSRISTLVTYNNVHVKIHLKYMYFTCF